MSDSALHIVIAIFASSGFWALLLAIYQRKVDKSTAQQDMLKGLGHDRIMELGLKYIDRGYILHEEYENLVDYLFEPYKKLKGNGTAERVVDEVKELPIRDKHPHIKGELIND